MVNEELAQLHDAQALRFELRAADEVSAETRKGLQRISRAALKTYARLAGSLHAPLPKAARKPLRLALDALLASLPIGVKGRLTRMVKDALKLGVEQAQAQITQKVVVSPRPDRNTRRVINSVEKWMAQELAETRKLLRTTELNNLEDVEAILARAQAVVTTAEKTARRATNTAISTGSQVVANAIGAQRLWRPEPGACLHCLAYAGELAEPNGTFPAGLTFADSPISDEPVSDPPLHDWCRCRTVPWLGAKGGDDTSAITALKREAQRAVLRGEAHGSEASRIRAVDRLLKQGTVLPKSVEKKARNAVAAGRF